MPNSLFFDINSWTIKLIHCRWHSKLGVTNKIVVLTPKFHSICCWQIHMTRTSSSDERQKLCIPKNYGTVMMSSDNQDRSNRITTNTDWCSLLFHSSGEYAEMSLNAQRLNRLLHSILVNRAPCGSPGENGSPRICQYLSATPVSISCWHFR